jgi:hypothetical protein
MAIILPYEDKLDMNDGAFIDPSGNILFTYGNHLDFAKNYCFGSEFDYLSYAGSNNEEENHIKEDSMDIFSLSKLNKKQLKLLKLYLNDYHFLLQHDLTDFLVLLLRFDKIEKLTKRYITTTNAQPHIRFYNYYLMEWRIENQKPIKYNSDTKQFESDENFDWLVSKEDMEAEGEIEEIKTRVLKKDRPLFFK